MEQNEKPGIVARLLQRRREETLLAALALVLDSVELAAFLAANPHRLQTLSIYRLVKLNWTSQTRSYVARPTLTQRPEG